jgi:hypothetical protein
MDKHKQEYNRVEKDRRNKSITEESILSVLHHNVRSINNKLPKLDLLLNSNLKHIDVLYCTEHWLKEDYLKIIKIDQYILFSYFSR